MLSFICLLCLVACSQAKSFDHQKRQFSAFDPNYYAPRPVDGDLKLSGGSHDLGRLEIAYAGQWHAVCDDFFTWESASVACRQMGFASGTVVDNIGYQYGYGPDAVIDDVQCHGSEAHLWECPHIDRYHPSYDCSGALENVVIKCSSPAQPSHTQVISGSQQVVSLDIQSVRMVVNGQPTTGHQGLLQVQIDNVYKYVCSNHFDDMDAKVACRMMNYDRGQALAPYPFNAYLQFLQIDRMWMDDFHCRGTETALDQCPNMGYDRFSTNCRDKSMLAAISCVTGAVAPPPETPVQLVDGTGQYDGRVKCLHGDQYYPVCADGFSAQEAQVVCNQLFGYYGMIGTPILPYTAESNAYYMQGFYDVQCQGTEESLAQCFSVFINNQQRVCYSGDATVVCRPPY